MEHKDVTDPNIHEPKGIATAAAGTVYVANGEGSGSWNALSTSGGGGTSAGIKARGSFGSTPGFPGQGLSNTSTVTRTAPGTYSVVFGTPLTDALYQVISNAYSDDTYPNLVTYAKDKTVYGFTISCRSLSGPETDAIAVDFVVFGT